MPPSQTPNHADEPLTLADAVNLALKLHQAGDLAGAERIYRGALDIEADIPVALHFLGVLRHQQGANEEALALIDRSLALSPNESGWHNNRGNTLLKLGRDEEAIAAWRRSIALSPHRADGYPSLERYYEERGRIPELVHLHAEYVVASPEGRPHGVVARSYARLGRMEEAAAAYRRWLDEEPDHPVARHMYLTAIGQTPERCADDYVATAFDNYADRFDEHIHGLDYRGPGLVAEEVARAAGPAQGALDTLDAGCGTGLCGPLVKPWAKRLDGVDLSSKMLERAAALAVYDDLVCDELTRCLIARPGAYDLIVSGDTLCYFGALEQAFAAARAALRPGGLFVFTLEADEAQAGGYRLGLSGRYAHRAEYVAQAAQAAGFEIRTLRAAHLRNEGGVSLPGHVVTLARAG
ncbi:MAG: tetratricopeptide repeat protein [Rhizobiales bacterium]|nr:tetratricopeptide repeat protein [Hyphomicrobiales bacterium]